MTLKPTLAATLALGLAASPLLAEDIPKTDLNVVGSIGILSMYKDMEQPFWEKTIVEAIKTKPKGHSISEPSFKKCRRNMSAIGG